MGNRSVLLRQLVFACALGSGACGGGLSEPGSREWNVPITGTVRDPTGNPTKAAVVVLPILLQSGAAVRYGRCAGANGGRLVTTADAVGRFEVSMFGEGGPNFVCLIVQATTLTSTGEISGITEVDSVFVGPTQKTVDVSVTIGRS
jgi:hypothetical protein